MEKEFEELVQEYVEIIKEMPEVKKHLAAHWISGEDTEVYPITVWRHDIEIQWNTRREPTKVIAELEELGKKMGIVDYVYFSKCDGSCPDYICIKLTQSRYE